MKLHEYQAQNILTRYGIPVPQGKVADSVNEVRRIAERLGGRVVLKAQVLTGGRGHAGGIRLADDADEAENLAHSVFGMSIQGYPVSKILVSEAIKIEREIYLGMTLDRNTGQPVILASAEGNIEIARLERDTPERVFRVLIDPLLGVRAYQVRALAENLKLTRVQASKFVPIAMGLYQAFIDNEALLVEVNPLVICGKDQMVSIDARILIDDNALFRRSDLAVLRDESQETWAEQLARRYSVHYVSLAGEVACLANGAGLAMTTMDLLRSHGLRPACFVDLGGGANAERVRTALRLAMSDEPQVVIINVFGGVTRCDYVAQGVAAVCQELDIRVPIVLRFDGWNAQQGRELLKGSCIHLAESSSDLVSQAAELVRSTEEA